MVNFRVTIILRLFDRTWLPHEDPPMDKIKGVRTVRPEDVLALGVFAKERTERIASIMELLLDKGWICRGTRQAIIIEGTDMEARQVKELLHSQGFLPCEYEIKLEYIRKWGIM